MVLLCSSGCDGALPGSQETSAVTSDHQITAVSLPHRDPESTTDEVAVEITPSQLHDTLGKCRNGAPIPGTDGCAIPRELPPCTPKSKICLYGARLTASPSHNEVLQVDTPSNPAQCSAVAAGLCSGLILGQGTVLPPLSSTTTTSAQRNSTAAASSSTASAPTATPNANTPSP
jgi:hypothetical protein